MTPIASAPRRVAKFITENGRWMVEQPGGPAYGTIDQGPASVTDDSTTPLGITQPAGSLMRAWHAA
jgi:hypothetical protein